MPFGLSYSALRPVVPLLKAGRRDFDLLNLILLMFRPQGDDSEKYNDSD